MGRAVGQGTGTPIKHSSHLAHQSWRVPGETETLCPPYGACQLAATRARPGHACEDHTAAARARCKPRKHWPPAVGQWGQAGRTPAQPDQTGCTKQQLVLSLVAMSTGLILTHTNRSLEKASKYTLWINKVYLILKYHSLLILLRV